MQNTDNFGLQIYEGSDIFNPLTVENENMETIDEQMFLNSIATVSQAVEIKSGTVHALTRENPDAAMFRFVATSRFDNGDTFTVDGIQVSGLTTDGKTLADGAYVINANVLCCLTGSVLTLFVAAGEIATADNARKLGGQLPAYYGTASDVQSAITTAQAAGVIANAAQEQIDTINTTLNNLTNLSGEHSIGKIGDDVVYEKIYIVTFSPSTSGDIVVDSTMTPSYYKNIISIDDVYKQTANGSYRKGHRYVAGDDQILQVQAHQTAGIRIARGGSEAQYFNGASIVVRYTKL